MILNQHMHELLLRLDRANLDDSSEWVSRLALEDIPVHTRSYAQTMNYIVGRGSTHQREYKITAAGKTKLAENADANMAVMDKLENGFVPQGDEPAEPGIINHLIAPRSISPLPTQKITVTDAFPRIDARAQACVQAIDILGESFPEVIDLVEALVKINARKATGHE